MRLTVIVLVLSMLLTACAPAAAPTVSPTAPAQQAVAAAPTKAPAATSAPAAAPTNAPAPSSAPAAATSAPAGATKVIKFGINGPFTGPSARVGEEFKDSVTMAFDAVNWTIGDTKFEPVWMDDASDAETGSRAFERSITQNGIQFGLLNWHSFVAVAMMEVAAKYKVPVFFASGATSVVNDKIKSDPAKYGYWMAKVWPTPIKLTSAYVSTVNDAITKGTWKPAAKKVALYGNDTDWCREFAQGMKQQLTASGWQVVAEEYVPVGETDYYPLINKLKASGATLLAGTMSDASGFTSFIKQVRENKLNAMIVADGLGWVGEWYSLTGDASNGVLDQIPQWTTPKAKQFVTDFNKRFGIDPSPSSAGLAYDSASFFIKLAQETYKTYGAINKDTLYKFGQEQLKTGKFTFKDGILMKEYQYTSESSPDPVVDQDHYIFPVIQYSAGKSQIVWPDSWKQADLQLPASK